MTEKNQERLDPNKVNYCHQPSAWFQNLIDEDQGDWRSTRGRLAIETGRDPDSRSPIQMGGVTNGTKTLNQV